MLMQSKLVLVLFLLDASLILAVQKEILKEAMKFQSGNLPNGKVHPRILSGNEYSQQPVHKHFDQKGYPRSSANQHRYEPRPRSGVQYDNFENYQDQTNFVDNSQMGRRNTDLQGAYNNESNEYYQNSIRKRERNPQRDGFKDPYNAHNSRFNQLADSSHTLPQAHSNHPSKIEGIESRLAKIEEQEKRVQKTLATDFGPNGFIYKAIQKLTNLHDSQNGDLLSQDENTISVTSARGQNHVKVGVWKNDNCKGSLVGVLELYTDISAQLCQSWKHFTTPDKSAWHDHSANHITCESHSISYTHYPKKMCDSHGTRQTIADTCEQKNNLFMKVIDFSGCADDYDRYEDDEDMDMGDENYID